MDSKERKRLHRWEQKNRWMAHYELKYGVLPIEYGPPASGVDAAPTVLKAKCRFCECFGREALPPDFLQSKVAAAAAAAAAAGIEFPGSPMASSGDGAAALDENSSNADESAAAGVGGPLKKRKKRQTLKVFGPNFRTDNLESHLTREHPHKWKEYERLRDADKKVFFPEGASDIHATAKELILAQQAAAAANAAAAMSVATRNAMVIGVNGGANGSVMQTNGVKVIPSYSAGSSIKHMVTTDIMSIVEQLLASSVLRQQVSSLQDGGASGPLWQLFVREDERLAEAAATMGGDNGNDMGMSPSGGLTATGDIKLMSSEFCTVSLRNEALFFYIVDVLSARQSLDTALAMVHASQRLVPDAAALLSNVTLADISGVVHQVMGLNLACISQLMTYAWGYSLFLRFVTHHGTGFLDLRLQVAVNDDLEDLHLISIPLDAAKHNVETLGALIAKTLTNLDARAMEKLVGVTIDGDHYHMHKYKGIGALLKKETEELTSQAAFYVLYSGTYHISFIVNELLDHCEADHEFLTSLTALEGLCRGNMTLRGLMGPEPTRFVSAHWLSIFNACEWLAMDRETILNWAAENQQLAKLPSTQWWVTLFVLRDVLKDVYAAFKKCKESSRCFADVQKNLSDLVFQIRLKFNIKPAMPNDATGIPGVVSAAAAGDLAASLTTGSVSSGGGDGSGAHEASSQLDPCEFSYQDFVSFVIPLDLFMYEAFQHKSIDGITDEHRVALYQRFHLVLMLLVNKVLAVINSSPETPLPPADPNSTSNPPHQYSMQIPPSTPYEFISINNVAAMDVLNQQRFRIRSKWAGKVLAMITEDRNRMMAECAHPGALYEAATHGAKLHQSGASNFREVWKPFAVEFASLASFAIVFGGLLSVTRTGDDELAHFYYTTNKFASASNLALEAHLHASQFHKLNTLRRHGDSTVV